MIVAAFARTAFFDSRDHNRPRNAVKVTVSFGDNTIYLDLKDCKSAMSRTLNGVPQILKERKVIEDYEVQLLVTLIILDV